MTPRVPHYRAGRRKTGPPQPGGGHFATQRACPTCPAPRPPVKQQSLRRPASTTYHPPRRLLCAACMVSLILCPSWGGRYLWYRARGASRVPRITPATAPGPHLSERWAGGGCVSDVCVCLCVCHQTTPCAPPSPQTVQPVPKPACLCPSPPIPYSAFLVSSGWSHSISPLLPVSIAQWPCLHALWTQALPQHHWLALDPTKSFALSVPNRCTLSILLLLPLPALAPPPNLHSRCSHTPTHAYTHTHIHYSASPPPPSRNLRIRIERHYLLDYYFLPTIQYTCWPTLLRQSRPLSYCLLLFLLLFYLPQKARLPPAHFAPEAFKTVTHTATTRPATHLYSQIVHSTTTSSIPIVLYSQIRSLK